MKRTWGEYIATVIVAIGLALLVRNFVATAYKIPTGSMRPALLPGDFIFVNRLAYAFGNEIQKGHLVALSGVQQTTTSYIKRVVGVEGDRVEIKGGILHINDTPAEYTILEDQSESPKQDLFEIREEKTIASTQKILISRESGLKEFGPIIVPPGEVFLLGDNRDTSEDSRFWGTVSEKAIFGRVSVIWFSVENRDKVRWQRILTVPR